MTSVAEELDFLRQWMLKPQHQGLKLFEDLLRAEFLPGEQQRRSLDQRVAGIAHFAATRSPFYRDYYAEHGMSPRAVRGVADLPRLPVLGKATVIDREMEIRAETLPASEQATITAYSSGTTGKRTRVLMTNRANMMFTVLATRLYRWFRMDLSKTQAAFLAPRAFAHPLDDSPKQGIRGENDEWGYASEFFVTGPSVFMCSTCDVEQRQQWLEQHRPAYLVADPAVLEEHAFAKPEGVLDSLAEVMGISSHMSETMRRRIEQSFAVPVDQNYGANEIGIMAGRCRRGRYHVHTEHCHVEITDADGQPCGPGETGRMLVTGLSNLAMPLLRFDIGDLATVPAAPCPCGRTLPSFENIEGKFRRWANVPPGTWGKYLVIIDTFNSLPADILKNVRGYQLHMNLDNSLVFRVRSTADLPEAMTGPVLQKWAEQYPAEPKNLSFERVDRFVIPPNGKVPGFTTDYPDQPYVEPERD